MKKAVMTAPACIEFREAEKPVPGEDEVLIRISRIGICGSDIHVYHGTHPNARYPVVQGHEVSGTVSELGRGAGRFSPGDRVTFMPQLTCGACYPCTHGMYHICDNLKVMGFQAEGAAQEYLSVPEGNIVPLPDGMSLDFGAMIEPVAVAVHALGRTGSVGGQRILVLGAGTIGNLVGQVAKGLGAASVMICDLSDYRLAVARECGMDHAVNVEKEDLSNELERHFGPDRADLTLDCAGAEQTISAAVAHARKGTTIVLVGVFGTRPEVDLAWIQRRELTLTGTQMYQRRDYETAIDLIRTDRVRLEPLLTTRFPFDRYADAYRYIDEAGDGTIKVMIDVG